MNPKYQEYKNYIEGNLAGFIPVVNDHSRVINESINYSLMAGGKRLRPVLLMAALEMAGGTKEAGLPYAAAIECIHTYSLIHDDLPAMDNDDLRRGKPTNHKVYGDGIAVLAGDGLLNTAFEIISNDLMLHIDNSENINKRIIAFNIIAKAAGVQGMIGGQTADLINENSIITAELLDYIHVNKTSALIKASIMAGLNLGNPTGDMLNKMSLYSDNLGLAFQIADDILDVKGNSQELGKNIGMDQASGKNTYVSMYGLEGAVGKLNEISDMAVKTIKDIDESKFFSNLVYELAERTT